VTITARHEQNSPIYSPAKELEWAEFNLVKIMIILGVDPSLLNSVSIEEMTEALDLAFKPVDKPDTVQSEESPRRSNAAQSFLNKQRTHLKIIMLRSWRRRNIARWEVFDGDPQ
jgi:hypothetical protein